MVTGLPRCESLYIEILLASKLCIPFPSGVLTIEWNHFSLWLAGLDVIFRVFHYTIGCQILFLSECRSCRIRGTQARQLSVCDIHRGAKDANVRGATVRGAKVEARNGMRLATLMRLRATDMLGVYVGSEGG